MECPSYIVTDEEVEELVRYWHRRWLDEQWWWFVYGIVDVQGVRKQEVAGRRIELAKKVIGNEAVDKAVKEVEDKFKSGLGDARAWDVFENGFKNVTEEEWKNLRREWGWPAVGEEPWRSLRTEWKENEKGDAEPDTLEGT